MNRPLMQEYQALQSKCVIEMKSLTYRYYYYYYYYYCEENIFENEKILDKAPRVEGEHTAYAEAQRFKGLQPAPSQKGIYEVFHGSPALLAMLDGSAWLHALAVKPEYRGQKIGLALFNDQLLLAESLGLSGILMSTYNPLVYEMAKKRGFEDMTTFSVEDFDGQNRREIFRKWNLGMALGGLTFRSNDPQTQYKVEVQLPSVV